MMTWLGVLPVEMRLASASSKPPAAGRVTR